jgi:hypothetical protein
MYDKEKEAKTDYDTILDLVGYIFGAAVIAG